MDSGNGLDRELARTPADAIVLDLMMSGEDGLAICRRLQASGDMTPIVMLTARGDAIDRIIGLETGVDDDLPKPFEPRELVARLSAVLRRTRGMGGLSTDDIVTVGSLAINLSARTVSRDGASPKLSSREFARLAALARRRGRPLSRADDPELIKTVWGVGYVLVADSA